MYVYVAVVVVATWGGGGGQNVLVLVKEHMSSNKETQTINKEKGHLIAHEQSPCTYTRFARKMALLHFAMVSGCISQLQVQNHLKHNYIW